MIKNNSDILFMYDVTMANANGDPDQENRPRMDYDTKTMLVSDSRLKRNVRDFLGFKNFDIFIGKLNDAQVTKNTMFEHVMASAGISKKDPREKKEKFLIDHYIDIRMFGATLAIGDENKKVPEKEKVRSFTGAIQIGWGYSLHPVDLVKSNKITPMMGTKDDNSTFGNMYKAHYGLMAHNITVNKYNAAKTSLTEKDKDIFSHALVQSLMNNVTHSKQGLQPLLYLEVVYADDFDGYMGDMRRFLQTEYNQCVRSLNDITVDFSKLSETIENMKAKGYIKEVLLWTSPFDKGFKNLPNAEAIDLFKPVTE